MDKSGISLMALEAGFGSWLTKSTKPEVFLGSDIVRKFVKTILTTTACNTRQEPKMTMTLAKRPVEMCTKPYLSFRGGSKRNQAENRWKKSDQAVGVKKYPIFKYNISTASR